MAIVTIRLWINLIRSSCITAIVFLMLSLIFSTEMSKKSEIASMINPDGYALQNGKFGHLYNTSHFFLLMGNLIITTACTIFVLRRNEEPRFWVRFFSTFLTIYGFLALTITIAVIFKLERRFDIHDYDEGLNRTMHNNSHLMSMVQSHYICCGVAGPSDYENVSCKTNGTIYKYENGYLPTSCCKDGTRVCNKKDSFQDGCGKTIVLYLYIRSLIICVFVIFAEFFKCLGGIMGVCIAYKTCAMHKRFFS